MRASAQEGARRALSPNLPSFLPSAAVFFDQLSHCFYESPGVEGLGDEVIPQRAIFLSGLLAIQTGRGNPA